MRLGSVMVVGEVASSMVGKSNGDMAHVAQLRRVARGGAVQKTSSSSGPSSVTLVFRSCSSALSSPAASALRMSTLSTGTIYER